MNAGPARRTKRRECVGGSDSRGTLGPIVLTALLFLTACSSDSDSPEPDPSGADLAPTAMAASDQERFLMDNAARDGVVVTDSGLQYEILRDAGGPKPAPDSTVTLDYAGTLIDGTEFDSSYARGEPTTFPLGGVIDGFAEGIRLMSVGSEYRLVLPAELAYGDRGTGADIAPGATLIFTVELLEINST